MSKKLTFIVIAIIIVIAGLAWAGFAKGSSGTSSTTADSAAATDPASTPAETTPSPSSPTQEVSDCQSMDKPEITYDNSGFSPKCIKVKSGTAVSWKNSGSTQIQIGADPHPSHTGNREVSDGQFTLNVDPGATATSTLTTKGQHGFHNHLNPTAAGVIIVE
jgi:plastocyanin